MSKLIEDRQSPEAAATCEPQAQGASQEIPEWKRTEEALRQSQQKYSAIHDHAPFAIALIKHPEGTIAEVNEAWARLFECPREEAIGKTGVELGLTVDETAWRRLCDEIHERGSIRDHEMAYSTRSGEHRFASFSFNPVEIDGQQYHLGTAIDITERKGAEEALRASEERFRVAQDLSPDGFTIFRPLRDRRGRVTDFVWVYENAAIARMNGTDPQAVVGRRLLDLFPHHRQTPFYKAYREVAETGEPRILEAPYHGETIKTLTWFRVVVVRMGEYVVILGQDITDRKRVEEALRESEERFRSLFDSSPDAVFLTRPDGTILSANSVACAMFGRSEQELRDLGRSGILDSSDPRVAEGVAERRRTGRVHNKEATAIRRNGERFPVEVDSVILPGKPPRAFVIMRDITERKRAEEALRESEQRFRTVIENSRDGINMLDLATGRYVFMSPAQVEMTGFTAQEVNNFPVEEANDRIHPDDRELSIEQQRQVAAGHDLPEPVEYRWKVKSGEYRWFSDSRKLVRDAEGRPVALVGVSRDITDRKRVEEELRRSRDTLKAVLNAAPVGVVVSDAVGNIVLSNAGADQILGSPVADIAYGPSSKYQVFSPDGSVIPKKRRPLSRALKGRSVANEEILIKRVDGTEAILLTSATPLRTADREIWGAVVIFQDITDRKAVEKALRASKDELEHRVAHRTAELSEMVAALQEEITLRESAESALRQRSEQLRALASELTIAEQRERRRLAEVLHDDLQQLLVGAKFRLSLLSQVGDASVQQAAEEVRDLLDRSIECSRTLTGELSPPILYQAGLSAALEWLAVWMQEKHALAVNLEIDENAEPRCAETKVLLFQSVRELLFNAIKHAKVPTARVRLERVNGQIVLTVADDGVGFDLDGVMSHVGKTGGFGLFSIRERLGFLGGQLEIETTPGCGSRFRMRISDVTLSTDGSPEDACGSPESGGR